MNGRALAVIENPPAIRDVAPPLPAPGMPPWLIIPLALAALAVAIILWRLLRPKPAPEPQPSPARIASEALERLGAAAPETPVYPFAIAVSDVLRTFFQNGFNLPATRQTSPEFLAAATSRRELPARFHAPLADFLRSVDAAKFAGAASPQLDKQRLLDTAREIVACAGDGGRAATAQPTAEGGGGP